MYAGETCVNFEFFVFSSLILTLTVTCLFPTSSCLFSCPSQCWSFPVSGLQIEPEHLRIPTDRAGSGTVTTGGQHSLTHCLFPTSHSQLFHFLLHFDIHSVVYSWQRMLNCCASWTLADLNKLSIYSVTASFGKFMWFQFIMPVTQAAVRELLCLQSGD